MSILKYLIKEMQGRQCMDRKYNVYRKKFTSNRTGDVHYAWSVLETEPRDTDTATFEKVGEVVRGEDEGRGEGRGCATRGRWGGGGAYDDATHGEQASQRIRQ